MAPYQNYDVMFECDNVSVDFENLISFAIAVSKSVTQTHNLERSTM